MLTRPQPLWIALLATLALARVAVAQAGPAEAPAEAAAEQGGGDPIARAAEPVDLEQLLKLPTSLSIDYTVPKRGGATASEWRGRFTDTREALDSEREALSSAREELEKVAGTVDAWQIGPAIPGADASDAPLDYQLRQRIRRHRANLEVLEHDLRDLELEANLAGVPEEWRD